MMPSLTVFFYICDYFEITPGEFFNDETDLSLQMIQLIQDLKIITPEQLSHISAIVKDLKPH